MDPPEKLEAIRFSLAPGVNDILVVNSIIHTNIGSVNTGYASVWLEFRRRKLLGSRPRGGRLLHTFC